MTYELTASLLAAARYLRRNPDELLRTARAVSSGRVGLPLDALRWLASRTSNRAPRRVELRAVPPGLGVEATLDLMGNEVRAGAIAYVERVVMNSKEMRLELRLAEVTLTLVREAKDSPVATLLKSRALDLSRPGDLAAFMPRRPEILVDAKGDRVVLDFMRHPGAGKLRNVIATLTRFLTVTEIECDWEHLDLAVRVLPEGMPEAVGRARQFFRPAATALRGLGLRTLAWRR